MNAPPPLRMNDPRSLAPLTTLGLEARADEIHHLADETDVRAWLDAARHAARARLVLGGGSNVVFTRDFPGSIGVVAVPGIEHVGSSSRYHYVQAGGGVNWHAFVNWTLDNDLPGLENLSLIPGSVGAAPMQNIGAYGVELHERFESLEAMDLHTGERVRARGVRFRLPGQPFQAGTGPLAHPAGHVAPAPGLEALPGLRRITRNTGIRRRRAPRRQGDQPRGVPYPIG